MGTLSVFNFQTLNGYFQGPDRDLSWQKESAEQNEYAAEMLKGDGTLVFGRVTYEMMASYWPTPMALENDPVVAKAMNEADKIVFSRTLKKADWSRTTLLRDDLVGEIRKRKQTPGKDLCVLGSGSLLTQLARAGLVDAYEFMVSPVVLGEGTSTFRGLPGKLELELTASKIFKNGIVLLRYRPAEKS